MFEFLLLYEMEKGFLTQQGIKFYKVLYQR